MTLDRESFLKNLAEAVTREAETDEFEERLLGRETLDPAMSVSVFVGDRRLGRKRADKNFSVSKQLQSSYTNQF